MRLSFTTQMNQTYHMEQSDNLEAPIVWGPVPGATNGGGGSVAPMLDTDGANKPQRFYRLNLN